MTCLLVSGMPALAGSTSALDPYATVEAPRKVKAPKGSRAKVEPAEEPISKTYVTMPPDEEVATAKSKKSRKHANETVVSEKASSNSEGGVVQGFKDIGSGCGNVMKGAGAGMAAPFKGMAKGAKAAGSGTKKVGAAVSDGFQNAVSFFAKGGKAISEKTASAAGSAGGAIGGAFKGSKDKLAGIPNPFHHDKRDQIPGAPKLKNPNAPAGATAQSAQMQQPKPTKVAHGSRFHIPKLFGHRQPEVNPIASRGNPQ